MSKANCDEKPLQELRFAVLKKHGKIYGVLLEEVNEALRDRAKKLLRDEMVEKDSSDMVHNNKEIDE